MKWIEVNPPTIDQVFLRSFAPPFLVKHQIVCRIPKKIPLSTFGFGDFYYKNHGDGSTFDLKN